MWRPAVLGLSLSDSGAIYSRSRGEGLMVLLVSKVDAVGASPACWMQGLVKVLAMLLGGPGRLSVNEGHDPCEPWASSLE